MKLLTMATANKDILFVRKKVKYEIISKLKNQFVKKFYYTYYSLSIRPTKTNITNIFFKKSCQ